MINLFHKYVKISSEKFQTKYHYKHHKQEALEMMFKAMRKWSMTEGDYLEFGVYKGKSFKFAYKAAMSEGLDKMKFYAFDSFEGLPQVKGQDATTNHFHEGQYSCSESDFLNILKKENINLDKVITIPGYFDNSLTDDLYKDLQIKRAAVVWVDCDLYESTVPVLEFILPLVTSGSFIAFDDWHCFGADPNAGQVRAVREWLEKHPDIDLEYYRDFGVSGRIFLMQKS